MAMGCGDRHASEPVVWVIPDGGLFAGAIAARALRHVAPRTQFFLEPGGGPAVGLRNLGGECRDRTVGRPQAGEPILGSLSIHSPRRGRWHGGCRTIAKQNSS